MKQIVIAGNVGKTAEIRNAGQNRVTGWTVAVDDGWGDNKSTIWFDCNWWGQRGEKVAPYIVKGGKITVSGELSKREHDGKTYLTINVTDVRLQSKPEGGSQGGYGGNGDPRGGGAYGGGYDNGQQGGGAPAGGYEDSEIPF